jgi:hypothetical protein
MSAETPLGSPSIQLSRSLEVVQSSIQGDEPLRCYYNCSMRKTVPTECCTSTAAQHCMTARLAEGSMKVPTPDGQDRLPRHLETLKPRRRCCRSMFQVTRHGFGFRLLGRQIYGSFDGCLTIKYLAPEACPLQPILDEPDCCHSFSGCTYSCCSVWSELRQ